MPSACCAAGANNNNSTNKCGPKSEPPAWMARSSVDSIAESVIKPGAVVLLRADLNVPLSPSSSSSPSSSASPTVLDDARVVAAVPTILYLTQRGAKVLLLTHVGRPKKGERDPALSTDALVPVLEAALKKASTSSPPPVSKIDACVGPRVAEAAASCPDGGVVLLENVRFYPGEEKNDPAFAEELANGGSPASPLKIDLYVNDAFGVSHRKHASVVGPPQYLPSAAGLLLQKEIDSLGKLLGTPDRPFVAVVGGAKVADKLGVLKALLHHVDALVVGGGMAFTFLAAQGHSIGGSLVDWDRIDDCRALLASGTPIHLPTDIVALEPGAPFGCDCNQGEVRTVGADIPDGWQGLDIGPDSVAAYADCISTAGTVLWNGPMGVFEDQRFSAGTAGVDHTSAVGLWNDSRRRQGLDALFDRQSRGRLEDPLP